MQLQVNALENSRSQGRPFFAPLGAPVDGGTVWDPLFLTPGKILLTAPTFWD